MNLFFLTVSNKLYCYFVQRTSIKDSLQKTKNYYHKPKKTIHKIYIENQNQNSFIASLRTSFLFKYQVPLVFIKYRLI